MTFRHYDDCRPERSEGHEGERRRSSGRSCLSREAASSAGPDDASRNEAPRNMPGAFFLSSFFRARKKEDIQSKHFQNIRNRTLKNNRSEPASDLKLSAQYVLTVKSLRTKRHNDLKFLVQYVLTVKDRHPRHRHLSPPHTARTST